MKGIAMDSPTMPTGGGFFPSWGEVTGNSQAGEPPCWFKIFQQSFMSAWFGKSS
jgi:hypothetical protein